MQDCCSYSYYFYNYNYNYWTVIGREATLFSVNRLQLAMPSFSVSDRISIDNN